jgi:tripartite-type tricarboxylate transporter receptor subunit TctC
MKTSLRQASEPQRPSQPRRNNRPRPKIPSSGQHPRRRFLMLAAGTAALPAVSRIARAQTYPARPVRIVVGFAAGGAIDIHARLVGQWLSERLGRQFIVENRPGADGNIGTEAVLRAPPDGYTLLQFGSEAAINATLYDKLNFNFMRDITPVAAINQEPLVMVVNPSVPAQTVGEFISYAMANPSKINMGSGGVGSPSHVFGERFKLVTGINMIHVPYRGGGPLMADLIGGQVQVTFNRLALTIGHIRTGQLRALAVTSPRRSPALPNIPPLGDFVPGSEAMSWVGIGARRNTPTEIIDKLNREINAALADPTFTARLADLGTSPMAMTPADFGKLIADETEKWGKVIRAANIKAE